MMVMMREIEDSSTISSDTKRYKFIASESINRYIFLNYHYQNIVTVNLPLSVTRIKAETFKNCNFLNSINLENIEYIGCGAFYNTGLVSLNLLSVTCIALKAFSKCFNLKQVVIMPNNTKIASCVFMDCKKLVHINLPGKITYICSNVFKNCKSLKSITLPDSIRQITWNSFKNCTSLKNINLNNIVIIGPNAFENCRSLKSITLQNIREISKNAFANCFRLGHIIINNPKSIDEYAFDNCVNLTSVKVTGNVSERIRSNIFSRCRRLIHWDGNLNSQLSIMIMRNQLRCFQNIERFLHYYDNYFEEINIGKIITDFLIEDS